MSIRSPLVFQAGNLLYWASLYFYVPILSVYAREMGASLTLIGVMLSAYGAMQLLFRIPVGVASDLVGKRRPFVIGAAALTALGAACFALSPAPWVLVVARAITGLAACGWVAITVMYSGYFAPQHATRAIGQMGLTNSLGQVIATWTGGLAANAFGWNAPFVLSITTGLLAVLAMSLCVEGQSRRAAVPAAETARALWSVASSRGLLIVSVISALNTFATHLTVFGFVPVYARGLGASAGDLGMITSIPLIPTMVAQPFTAALTQRFGFRWVVVAGLMVAGATTLAIPATGTLLALLVILIVGGAGRGVLGTGLMSMAILSVPQEQRATSMGVYQAVYAVGMFLGPLTGGIVGDLVGLPVVFAGTGIAMLLTAGIALAILTGDAKSDSAIPRPGRQAQPARA